MSKTADDLKALAEARPYLRSAGAFLIFLIEVARGNDFLVSGCYEEADYFLDRLAADIASGSPPARGSRNAADDAADAADRKPPRGPEKE